MKDFLLRIGVGILTNVGIAWFYTLIQAPDRKFGYYFAEMSFGLLHMLVAIVVLLVPFRRVSSLYYFTTAGNGLFLCYFLFFMVDFSEIEPASWAIIAGPCFLLLSLLMRKGYRHNFRAQESL